MIRKFQVGHYETNTYLITKNNKAIIIDPGYGANQLLDLIADEQLEVQAILITHGHADHIDSIGLFCAPIYIHEDELECLTDIRAALYHLTGTKRLFDPNTLKVNTIKEGDIIPFGNEKISVIHTPGHSRGSVCYLYNDRLFSGDTLFQGTVGRTDLPRSSAIDLSKSLLKLEKLANNTRVYPGHGEDSTIQLERQSNPYMTTKRAK